MHEKCLAIFREYASALDKLMEEAKESFTSLRTEEESPRTFSFDAEVDCRYIQHREAARRLRAEALGKVEQVTGETNDTPDVSPLYVYRPNGVYDEYEKLIKRLYERAFDQLLDLKHIAYYD